MESTKTILIVDDSPESLSMLMETLTSKGFIVRPADSGELALESVAAATPDLILLDILMPNMNGFEVCRQLKAREETRNIPVVIMTALDDTEKKVEGFVLGAVDYITKPFQPEELFARINTHLEIKQLTEELKHKALELEQRVAERTEELCQVNEALRIDIAERKQAEAALRNAAIEWSALFDAIPDGVSIHDPDHKILKANRSLCQIIGKSEEELIGKKCYNIFHGKENPVANCPIELTRKTLRKENAEFFEATLNKWLSVSSSPVFDDSGQLIRLVHIIRDITEHKHEEEALRESEERHRILLSESPDPTFSFTPEGRYIYANKAFADGVGKPAEEIIGRSLWDVFSKDEADKRFASLSQAFRTGEHKSIEVRVPRTDGDRYYITSITPIKDIRGGVISVICSSKDITERKHSEEAIRLSEEKFYKAFEAGPESITIASLEDGRYIEVNNVFLKTTGFQRNEVIGHTSTELGFWVNMNERLKYIEELSANGSMKNFSTRYRMRNSEVRDFSVSSEVIEIEGKKCSLNFILDVTEGKRAEEEKAKLQEQLVQSQKMESVGRLAGGVAHDFNNMLGVIFGHVEMAMEQVDPAQLLYSDLQGIQKAAKRSSDLTRQLLAFARKQTISPKVIDLNETIEGMLKMLRRLIGEDIHLAWLPGINLWPIRMNPSQIDQILANLCVNARDAIAGVGKVTIETEQITFDTTYCNDHPGFVIGEYVLLTMSDNGSGMDKETLSHLFEPFFTTKGVGKGTGLGLATVYGIIKQNNGWINVYSEPGQGTNFKIYLPRHEGEDVEIQKDDSAGPIACGCETILLVEDEGTLLDMGKRMLEKQGYQVLAVGTPGEAIRLAAQKATEIHLLMTDVVMPEMNGRELAKNVLSLKPNLKCLFTSGYTANVIAHHGVLDTDVHFIQKPFSRKDLASKVREVLDSK